ncbi:PEP-CTERM sorting domain-containing protein [Haloferula rosea]|uniref:PEP-CTERM sorting domain-containing protein n=1 Tax=Haloferula rosea TaxID=490093 RepID=A0A934RB14_9BACT|nr:PEP-CTERM sorting domain-containing protein [Haloferula rosea]MBK1825686.1 PEP-CTERM sorting domain-containing protein [Haloferula rosea]
MRKTHFLLLASITSPVAHGALTFNIDRIGPNESPNPSGGAIAVGDVDGMVNAAYSQSPAGLDGQASGTMTITLTSLTLDGNGADDDTAVFNFTVSATGGTINNDPNDLGVNGNGGGRISDVSESLTFTYTGGSITLGAGATPGDTGVIDFIGFNQIDFSQFTNDGTAPDDVASLAFGGGAATNVTTDEFTFAPNSDAMTVGYVSGDTNDGFKVNHFRARFSLDVVPEPSTALLSMIGLTGFLLRRRR